jgi:hypothetical protein
VATQGQFPLHVALHIRSHNTFVSVVSQMGLSLISVLSLLKPLSSAYLLLSSAVIFLIILRVGYYWVKVGGPRPTTNGYKRLGRNPLGECLSLSVRFTHFREL